MVTISYPLLKALWPVTKQEEVNLEESYYLKFGNMSKIGKKPIEIPEGITVSIEDDNVKVKGKNATLSVQTLTGVEVEIKDGEIVFTPKKARGIGIKKKQVTSNWGTMRALVANAIEGAAEDFIKELMIEGVGFKAEVQDTTLVLNVGFSHQVKFPIPEGVKIIVEKNLIKVSGSSKQVVGETAASIRKIKKPEPYKGKGIMYKGEIIRRKAGKRTIGGA